MRWLLLTVPLACAALGGIVLLARRLARGLRDAVLVRVPVVAEQEVELAAGPWVLHVETPLFSRRMRGLRFGLLERSMHREVRLGRVWIHQRPGGLRRVSLAVRRFTITLPGPHLLRTDGLRAGTDYTDCALLVARPSGALLVGHTLGMLALGWVAVASIVASIVAVGGPDLAGWRVAEGPPVELPGDVAREGGRTLRVGDAPTMAWRQTYWAAQRLWVAVPGTWEVRMSNDRELDLRERGRPAPYLVVTVMPVDLGLTPEALLAVHLRSAAEQLASGEIDGYAVRTLGTVTGVAWTSDRAERIAWIGVRRIGDREALITLLLGAPAGDFARSEPALGAILASVRFE